MCGGSTVLQGVRVMCDGEIYYGQERRSSSTGYPRPCDFVITGIASTDVSLAEMPYHQSPTCANIAAKSNLLVYYSSRSLIEIQ
jgi:hypothetical protein